jgi:hypothetical protein
MQEISMKQAANSIAYSSTLKMGAVYSSKTSADFQRTTQRYFPEDRTLQIIYSLSILW